MLFETLDEISVPIDDVFKAVTVDGAIERFAAKRGLILRRVDLVGMVGLGWGGVGRHRFNFVGLPGRLWWM